MFPKGTGDARRTGNGQSVGCSSGGHAPPHSPAHFRAEVAGPAGRASPASPSAGRKSAPVGVAWADSGQFRSGALIRKAAPLFCQACEAPGVEATALGFISDDGASGEIAGFACRRCRFIWEDPAVEPVVTGRVDLNGQRPLDWILARLRALGCDPQPRRP